MWGRVVLGFRGGYASGCARCINRASAHAPAIHSEITLFSIFLANSQGQLDYHLVSTWKCCFPFRLDNSRAVQKQYDKLTPSNLSVPCEEVSCSNKSPSPFDILYLSLASRPGQNVSLFIHHLSSSETLIKCSRTYIRRIYSLTSIKV